jgi:hypothetical protein
MGFTLASCVIYTWILLLLSPKLSLSCSSWHRSSRVYPGLLLSLSRLSSLFYTLEMKLILWLVLYFTRPSNHLVMSVILILWLAEIFGRYTLFSTTYSVPSYVNPNFTVYRYSSLLMTVFTSHYQHWRHHSESSCNCHVAETRPPLNDDLPVTQYRFLFCSADSITRLNRQIKTWRLKTCDLSAQQIFSYLFITYITL